MQPPTLVHWIADTSLITAAGPAANQSVSLHTSEAKQKMTMVVETDIVIVQAPIMKCFPVEPMF